MAFKKSLFKYIESCIIRPSFVHFSYSAGGIKERDHKTLRIIVDAINNRILHNSDGGYCSQKILIDDVTVEQVVLTECVNLDYIITRLP